MVIPEQYRHHLYAAAAPADSTQDEDGNILDAQAGAASWIYIGKCRQETNGSGRQVRTGDGRTAVYSSLLQLPKGSTRVQEGTEVMVSDRILTETELAADLTTLRQTGVIRAQGRCLNYDAGSLHDRLWI